VDWEGMVRFESSRYSVPPQHAGQRVVVELRGQEITIRCGEMIIASHEAAIHSDSHVVQTAHVEALWKATLKRLSQRPTPLPHWQMRFATEVEHADLGRYEVLTKVGVCVWISSSPCHLMTLHPTKLKRLWHWNSWD
jgi:hypothetical protein